MLEEATHLKNINSSKVQKSAYPLKISLSQPQKEALPEEQNHQEPSVSGIKSWLKIEITNKMDSNDHEHIFPYPQNKEKKKNRDSKWVLTNKHRKSGDTYQVTI